MESLEAKSRLTVRARLFQVVIVSSGRWWIRGWCALAMAACGAVVADTVTFMPVADTTIFALKPGNNFGAQNELIVGSVNRDGPVHRARMLLRFDISGLPPGVIVTNVSLGLEVLVENNGEPPSRVGAHRLLQDWGEGNKAGRQGASAESGEATWLSRIQGADDWAEPGGRRGTDFVASASAVASIDGPGTYTFVASSGMIGDVVVWLATPERNFGWIVIGEDEAIRASAHRVGSRERTSGQPRLRVEYATPQVVPFDAVGMDGNAVQLRFRAEAGSIYSVWHRPSLGTGSWRTLTNVVSKFVPLDAMVTDTPETAFQFYQLVITGQVD